jgi:hypothetical protein
LRFDIDPPSFPVFSRIRENNGLIEKAVGAYTVVDAEDGFRLISMTRRAAFIGELTELNTQRQDLAKWLDNNWSTQVIPLIREEHPDHFDMIKDRLPLPPFGPRMEVTFRLRPVGAVGPDDIQPEEWEELSPQARDAAIAKMLSEGEQMARDRAEAIINGAMEPILEAALKLQGRMANPAFNPDKPEDSKNRRFLPGIDSGSKHSGFLDSLLIPLERIMNFKQFMSPEVIKQADAAMLAVKRAGGNITRINGDRHIQDAIRDGFARLGDAVTGHITSSRRERSITL